MEKWYKDSKSSTPIGMCVPCWITACLLATQDEKQQQLCTAALTRLWDKQALLSTHTSGLFSSSCSWSALFPLVWGRFENFCAGGIFVFPGTLLGLLNQRTPSHAWNCSLEKDVPPFLTVLSCNQHDWQPGQALCLWPRCQTQVVLAPLFDEISLARIIKTTFLGVWNICDKPIWTQSLLTRTPTLLQNPIWSA